MADTDIINSLGGTDNVANLCGLSKSAVSQWRKRGIPDSWRRFLQASCPPRHFKPIAATQRKTGARK